MVHPAGPSILGTVAARQVAGARIPGNSEERRLTDDPQVPTYPTRRLAVLVVIGAVGERDRIANGLRRHCGLVETARKIPEAEAIFARCRFDCVVIEGAAATADAGRWIVGLRSRAIPIIGVADQVDVHAAIGAMRVGMSDLIQRPLKTAALMASIKRLCTRPDRTSLSTAGGRDDGPLPADDGLIGECEAMSELRLTIARVAPLPATILIEGETGTGKELAARMLHRESHRSGPFVPVNCGAIAPDLLESELFGHTKGAFTSAQDVREGLFVSAEGGTLFLDEISEMQLALQVKLLRALEEGAVRPVGSDRETSINVRIVASTQRDLAEMVAEGRFREDLFYRLNVMRLDLPRLADRPEDIRILAQHFMDKAAMELGLPALMLQESDFRRLEIHSWPGNVRELRNYVERSLMMGGFVDATGGKDPEARNGSTARGYPLEWSLEQVKESHMRQVLASLKGNKSAAARTLGISRKTLERNLGARDTGQRGPD
jgi:two-component system NtrC family response regulator